MEKPPYLTIVDITSSRDHDEEFAPLPYFQLGQRGLFAFRLTRTSAPLRFI